MRTLPRLRRAGRAGCEFAIPGGRSRATDAMAGRGPGEIPEFDAASAALAMVEVIEHGYEVDDAPLGGVAPGQRPEQRNPGDSGVSEQVGRPLGGRADRPQFTKNLARC